MKNSNLQLPTSRKIPNLKFQTRLRNFGKRTTRARCFKRVASLVLGAWSLVLPSANSQIVADGATNILSNVTTNITGNVIVGTNGSFTLLVLSDNALLTNSGSGIIGANTTAKSNEVQLLSASAGWLMGGNLFVGSNGAFNRLVVSNGATVRDGASFLGFQSSAASNNQALVTGPGSFWDAGILYLGFNGAGNQLVVRNGGAVSGYQGYVGVGSSNNLAAVTGSGSLWSNAAELYVSLDRDGNRLLVSNGGTVRNGAGYVGVNLTSSNGLALITDTGSVWSNALDLTIGYFSTNANQMIVSNGGTVYAAGNGIIGQATNANGNWVTVTDPGTSWLIRTNLFVGSNGAFNGLVVSNGAVASAGRDGFIGGTSIASSNSVIITGSGTSWLVASNLYVGSNSAFNRLVIGNGALVQNTRAGLLGYEVTSVSNEVVISDPGSKWLYGGSLNVNGTGNRLTITNGGLATGDYGAVGGNSPGPNNVAIVAGAGSLWSNRLDFGVGYSSDCRLVVADGGRVAGSNVVVGVNAPGNNQALVTGTGATCVSANDFVVGYFGSGNLLVASNGASIFANNSIIGSFASTKSNVVIVTGVGSYWNNASNVYVGNSGSFNFMMVSNGGFVSDFDGVIGNNISSSNNLVVVTGTNSTWTNFADFVVGFDGSNNRLVVQDGGAILCDSGDIGGFSGGNQALITGSGSRWINTGDHFFVGAEGNGSQLVVSNGALVGDNFAYVGEDSSNNVAWVSGSGSVWSNNAELYVGDFGPRNQLVVTNNGLVFAGSNVFVGANVLSASNRVVVDGGTMTVSNALGAGTLDVRRGTNVLNAGLIEVDQLVLTNTQGFFEFNGGTLITRGASINNNFVVGRTGTTPALWDVRSGSNHLVGGQVTIGDSASFNQLIITNGALLTNSGLSFIGQSAGANSNSATISGAASRWLQLNGVVVGGLGSGNRLVASNGATLLNSGGTSYIGNDLASSNNEAIISGPGTTWTSSTIVGEGGRNNRLLVSDGAQMTSIVGTIGELFAGTTNNLATVTGADSSWNADTFNIGLNGAGNQLVVSNSGLVSASNVIYLGVNSTSTNNRLTVDGGTLRATNASATGLLEIRRGTNVLNAGQIEADIVRMTNIPSGVLQFNGGTLSAKSSKISSGTILRIGDGVSPATMFLAGNGIHDFSGNLIVTVASNAVLTGNGTLVGGVSIASGGTLIPGSSVGKMIFSNAPALHGAVLMEISKNGTTLTNDLVQAVTGTLTYGGALVVTNLGPTTLANGDKFRLFNATNYAGSFTSLTLPPLDAGLDWTNKLLVDGSIEVFLLPPADRFWTNAFGGNYEVGSNWLNNSTPLPQDNANFTNNAVYQVNWSLNALAANAFFNAQSGTVTQAVGAFAWTLTNSYIVGRDISATAAVTHTSGTLRVTNSQSTAQLIVGDSGLGTFNLKGGEVVADTLLVPNGTRSTFNFVSGALRTRNTSVSTGSLFVVGDGASSATFELLGNGTNGFVNGLSIQSQGVLAGNGTLSGPVTVQTGGQLSPGAAGGAPALGKISSLSSPLLQGVTLLKISRSGVTTTNDQLRVLGPLTYGGVLTVTNIGTNALMAGDLFQLFTASSYGGAFTSLNLPPLGPGLSWKTNLLVDGSLEVFAPPAIPLSSVSYTQNFDSLASSGSANLWRDNSTLLGWYAAQSVAPNPITSYRASDGSDNNGALYSFGSTGSSERALGSIASDSVGTIAYGLCFSNDTATSISNFVVSYTGEQWRNAGSLLGGVTNTLTFWYRVGPSAITNPEPGVVINWTQVTNLGFRSPQVLATTTALDGNQATNRQIFPAVFIPGLALPPGQHVFFRWHDLNDSGADQGLAVDDLTITFSALRPQITSVILNPTSHFLQIFGQGESNQTYAIEAASNLIAPILWQRIGSNTADGAGLFQFTDTNAPSFLLRFYRALSP